MFTKQSLFTFSGIALAIIFSLTLGFFTLSFQSIRLDESQSLWMSGKSLPVLLKLTAEDVHVPLYGILLHFWIQIFGNNISSARMLSLIFSLITIPILYKVTREASTPAIAIGTILLYSFSPFIVWYTTEARTYALFTFITTINHFYFLRLLQSGGNEGKMGYFLSSLFGFYTHYFFILLAATQSLFLFGTAIYNRLEKTGGKEIEVPSLKLFLKQIAILGVAFSFLIPWIYYFVTLGAGAATSPQIPPPTSFNIFQVFFNFIFGFQSQNFQSFAISLWPLALIFLFFIFTKRQLIGVKSIAYFVAATFIPISIAFAVSFIRPVFLSRYLILVTPTLFIIIGWAIVNYPRHISSIFLAFSVVAMLGASTYQNISANTTVREDYRSVGSYLAQDAAAQDIVAVSAPFTIYPIEYSYNGNAKLVTIPEWNRYTQGAIPQFSESALKAQVEKYRNTYQRIFVVLSYDQGYQEKIRSYFDNNYELLSQREFPYNISVRIYKLRYSY
ncbi:MAG: glycosyltransferase family 39 protein [Candidatus Blackburnbacteria bacterium]|nr:glycosyltransferase family 39 protein [Candidatus Blackburnbacteria bacterium]